MAGPGSARRGVAGLGLAGHGMERGSAGLGVARKNFLLLKNGGIMETSIYRKAIPREADLHKLRLNFPAEKMRVGDLLSYEELTKVLSTNKDSHRFRSVIGKWRHELLVQHGISLMTCMNVGYKIASDSQKLSQSDGERNAAFRRIAKSILICSTIDRNGLNEDERKRFDRERSLNASIMATFDARKELEKPQI